MPELAIGFLAAITLLLLYGAKNTLRLQLQGTTTRGTITDKQVRRWKSGVHFLVDYKFQHTGGVEHPKERPVPKALYDSLAAGDSVDVVYLDANPAVHMLAADVSRGLRYYAVLLLVFISVTLWYSLRYMNNSP